MLATCLDCFKVCNLSLFVFKELTKILVALSRIEEREKEFGKKMTCCIMSVSRPYHSLPQSILLLLVFSLYSWKIFLKPSSWLNLVSYHLGKFGWLNPYVFHAFKGSEAFRTRKYTCYGCTLPPPHRSIHP